MWFVRARVRCELNCDGSRGALLLAIVPDIKAISTGRLIISRPARCLAQGDRKVAESSSQTSSRAPAGYRGRSASAGAASAHGHDRWASRHRCRCTSAHFMSMAQRAGELAATWAG